jgi:hypothetical protein
MKEKTVEKAISATRRNYNFGTAVIFEGRCIQVWPAEDGSFTLASGCYTEPDGLPEFEAMRRAGAEYKKIDMGAGLVKITATMTPEQFKAYLAAADEADWEA